MSRDINKFEKPELITQFRTLCLNAGFKVIITCVDRDYKEQQALFAQGREVTGIVNSMRILAGLPPITDIDNKRKVTWTLNSEHVVNLEDQNRDNDLARAFDFAIMKTDGTIDWLDTAAYKECAKIGESIGLYSGGRFQNKDWPHLQLKPIKGTI